MACTSLYGLLLSTPPNFLAPCQTTLLSCSSTAILVFSLNTDSPFWSKNFDLTIPLSWSILSLPPGIYLLGTFPPFWCLLLTFYQGGLFWPLYQKKTPNTEPSYLLSWLCCSSWYLSPFKILSLLNYWLIVSFSSPFTPRLFLQLWDSSFLTLWDTFISRKSLSSSVVTL